MPIVDFAELGKMGVFFEKGKEKITWGGQVRENILHLSPDEY